MIPPLFDSRINLTSDSNGQDYGNYRSDEVNKMIDEAAQMTDVDDAGHRSTPRSTTSSARTWPTSRLEVTQFYFLRGSKVTGYVNTPASNGYPDLGCVGVTS